MGPMTGRAAGYCAGYGTPGYTNPVGGRGFFGRGMGRGMGFLGCGGGRGPSAGLRAGWRNRFYATGAPGWGLGGGVPYGAPYAAPTRAQELDMLKGQAEQFEAALGDVRKRLQELEAEKTAE